MTEPVLTGGCASVDFVDKMTLPGLGRAQGWSLDSDVDREKVESMNIPRGALSLFE